MNWNLRKENKFESTNGNSVNLIQETCWPIGCNSLLQKNMPVIMMPTHRSHLDYILVTFILFCYDMKAPHVAAGDNLLIPVFG